MNKYIVMKPRHDLGVKTIPRMRWTVLLYKNKAEAIRASMLKTNQESFVLHIPKDDQKRMDEIYHKESEL